VPLLPWGAWSPDTSDYESNTKAHNILNVVPRGDGYGPFPSFAAATQAMFATCRGGFYALNSDGTITVFAGTSNALYKLNNTDFSWTPVSRVATCTISNASPAVITMSNTFVANEPVVFSTTGSLPTGLTVGTVYYVSATSLSGASFKVSATAGGSLINTSSAGSGTHSCTTHYSALSTNAQWQFAQTGNLVFATQANELLQVFTLGTSAAFSNSLGSPPQAAYISVVGRFLVLSGLLSQPYRIQWSGLGDFNSSASWTAGTNSSDFQDFPDGGIVRGVAGGEFGIVFQDQAIRRMSYIPGSSVIFQIERLTQDMGLFAPYSIIRAGTTVYFYANKGFHKIEAGGLPEQIGRERIDRTFFNDLDKTSLQLFIGASDPRVSFVYWAYKSGAGATELFDKILGFDPALDKFFPISVSGEYLLGVSQPGITLESLDTISSSIDALTLTLDAYATSVQPQIAAFDNTHKLGYFTGSNLEATLESAEQGTDGERLFVDGFRPVTDATSFFGSLSYRETVQDNPISTAEVSRNSRTGRCDIRRSTRYARFKVRKPAGTTWTFSAGVEPTTSQDGST
jgi:hypothetical protein